MYRYVECTIYTPTIIEVHMTMSVNQDLLAHQRATLSSKTRWRHCIDLLKKIFHFLSS